MVVCGAGIAGLVTTLGVAESSRRRLGQLFGYNAARAGSVGPSDGNLNQVALNQRMMVSGSLSILYICFAIVALLHKSEDKGVFENKLSKNRIIFSRLGTAAVLLIFTFAFTDDTVTHLAFLGIIAGICSLQVMIEE